MCRELPPTSQEESLPLPNTHTSIVTTASTVCAKQLRLKKKKKYTHTSFQPVDVLRVHPEELTLLVEQPDKIMGQIGLIVPWIQLFGQSEEGVWVLMEKVDLEYGLSIGEVILLQVVIETATWRSVRGNVC